MGLDNACTTTEHGTKGRDMRAKAGTQTGNAMLNVRPGVSDSRATRSGPRVTNSKPTLDGCTRQGTEGRRLKTPATRWERKGTKGRTTEQATEADE